MTYATLAACALGVAALGHVAARLVARRRGTLPDGLGRATALTALVLVVLTVVFDSVMIAADLFRFDDALLLGVRLGLAPLEDLAWPLATALLLPAIAAALAPAPDGPVHADGPAPDGPVHVDGPAHADGPAPAPAGPVGPDDDRPGGRR